VLSKEGKLSKLAEALALGEPLIKKLKSIERVIGAIVLTCVLDKTTFDVNKSP
jgi:hypothetical protein